MLAIYILAGIGALCILTTVITFTLAMVISIQNGKRYVKYEIPDASGEIAEVRFYDKALTKEEMEAVYNELKDKHIHDAIQKGDDGGVW